MPSHFRTEAFCELASMAIRACAAPERNQPGAGVLDGQSKVLSNLRAEPRHDHTALPTGPAAFPTRRTDLSNGGEEVRGADDTARHLRARERTKRITNADTGRNRRDPATEETTLPGITRHRPTRPDGDP